MKTLFFIMLVMLVSYSCNTEKTYRKQTQINLQEAVLSPSRENIESYCDNVFYVKLETSDSVLLRSPFYAFTSNAIIAYEGLYIDSHLQESF